MMRQITFWVDLDQVFSKASAFKPNFLGLGLKSQSDLSHLIFCFGSYFKLFAPGKFVRKQKKMITAAKDLGIWMDHASANLMEFTTDPIETKTLDSAFTHEEKEIALAKSENRMHKKEQHEQADYYRKLGQIIRNYEQVVLFGPTDAKVELYNTLKDNHLFADVKIEIVQADKLTENQQHAFIKQYFAKQ